MLPPKGVRFGSWSGVARLSRLLAWSLVALGIVLRLRQYLFDRSFWLDECLLALNVLNRSFGGLLRPLDNHQHAPAAFLLLEKAVSERVGTSELALRLIPLLAAVASLPLLRAAARRTVGDLAGALTLALFALSEPLIYYSSEMKQYSSDAAVAIGLFLLGLPILDEGLSASRTAVLAGAGAAAIWCSHPAVFVLAGIALSAGAALRRRGDRPALMRLLLVGGLWAMSFAANYAVALRHSAGDAAVRNYWQAAFPPVPPSLFRDASWFADRFFAIFSGTLGVGGGFAAVGALAFLVGCAVGFREHRSRLWLLLSPLPFVLIASALQRYPFEGRFLLFLAAPFLLVVGEGAARAVERDRVVGAALICLLLLFPAKRAAQNAVHPLTHEETRAVLTHIRRAGAPEDRLYGYRSSRVFEYYLPRLGFRADRYVGGVPSKNDWRAYAKDLERLRASGTVWIVFAGLSEEERLATVPFFLYLLDGMGARLDSVEAPGSAAYRYDLSRPTAATPATDVARPGQATSGRSGAS